MTAPKLLCPLCLVSGTSRELQPAANDELHQIHQPKPALVLECPEQDYDSSDHRRKVGSHYRRIIPIVAKPAPQTNGWHSSASETEPDGLPR